MTNRVRFVIARAALPLLVVLAAGCGSEPVPESKLSTSDRSARDAMLGKSRQGGAPNP